MNSFRTPDVKRFRAAGTRTLDDRVLLLLQSLHVDPDVGVTLTVTPREVATLLGVHWLRDATLEDIEAALERLVALGRVVEVS